MYKTNPGRKAILAVNKPDVLTQLGKRTVPMPNGCWAVDGDLERRATVCSINAHRYVWEAIHGPIGCNDHIHHLCRNPGCVRPDHLQRLSPREHYDAHADD